jgi:UDP-glucose 4-epimerase
MQRTIQGSKVCVVGGAGFLGSHLVDHLIDDRQCNVLVIDNLITGRRENIHPKAKFEYADITQSEHYLLQLFKHHKIEYVMNWAAEPYIPVSFARPLHVFDINAMGALKVINAAQEAGCKGILQVSSAEIYGNGCSLEDRFNRGGARTAEGEIYGVGKITEEMPAVPHSSYGAAKLAIDSLVQVRWKEAQTPCIALRLFNCIAEREGRPYIAPEIISQLAKQKTFANIKVVARNNEKWELGKVELGNNSFRDFQYGGDAVKASVELLEKGSFGEVYNLGSEEGIKMYDLAKLIGKLMGFETVDVITSQERIRPFEIWHLQSDNSKINSVIDYRPKVGLEEALQRTINYFHSNGNKWIWEN